jgi:hypothetical protein
VTTRMLYMMCWAGREAMVHPLGGGYRARVEHLIDESGDFGPVTKHSPFYILGLVLHDQSDNISGQLDQIHDNPSCGGCPLTMPSIPRR